MVEMDPAAVPKETRTDSTVHAQQLAASLFILARAWLPITMFKKIPHEVLE